MIKEGKESQMDLNELARSRESNRTMIKIYMEIHRFVDEFAKLREAVERNGYAALPTVEEKEVQNENSF